MSYRNAENDIEDPIFTGFTFSIDKNTSPLFMGGYKLNDSLVSTIVNNLNSYDKTGTYNDSQSLKFGFEDGKKIGYGLQDYVSVDIPGYGAVGYVYMADNAVVNRGSYIDTWEQNAARLDAQGGGVAGHQQISVLGGGGYQFDFSGYILPPDEDGTQGGQGSKNSSSSSSSSSSSNGNQGTQGSSSNTSGLDEDGIFGSKTEAAVKAFQKANGLTVDGIVGVKTWEKLGQKDKPVLKKGSRDKENVKLLQQLLNNSSGNSSIDEESLDPEELAKLSEQQRLEKLISELELQLELQSTSKNKKEYDIFQKYVETTSKLQDAQKKLNSKKELVEKYKKKLDSYKNSGISAIKSAGDITALWNDCSKVIAEGEKEVVSFIKLEMNDESIKKVITEVWGNIYKDDSTYIDNISESSKTGANNFKKSSTQQKIWLVTTTVDEAKTLESEQNEVNKLSKELNDTENSSITKTNEKGELVNISLQEAGNQLASSSSGYISTCIQLQQAKEDLQKLANSDSGSSSTLSAGTMSGVIDSAKNNSGNSSYTSLGKLGNSRPGQTSATGVSADREPNIIVNNDIINIYNGVGGSASERKGLSSLGVKAPQSTLDLVGFITDMEDLIENRPYTFLSVSGLDEAYKKYYNVHDPYFGSGDDTITIECNETLDLKVSAMFNKYFNVVYDRRYRRERLPINLRRFNCSIFVHDIRNFRDAIVRFKNKD